MIMKFKILIIMKFLKVSRVKQKKKLIICRILYIFFKKILNTKIM